MHLPRLASQTQWHGSRVPSFDECDSQCHCSVFTKAWKNAQKPVTRIQRMCFKWCSLTLAFSITLAPFPSHWNSSRSVTRMYTSPELMEEATGSTSRVWTSLRPWQNKNSVVIRHTQRQKEYQANLHTSLLISTVLQFPLPYLVLHSYKLNCLPFIPYSLCLKKPSHCFYIYLYFSASIFSSTLTRHASFWPFSLLG